MKKRPEDEIRFLIDRSYITWIATYGLQDALKICVGLKGKLTGERKRRHEDDKNN
jgi:hypothetical protein